MTDFDQKHVRAELDIYKHAGWHTWTEVDERRVRTLLKYARDTMPHLAREFAPFDEALAMWTSFASDPAHRRNMLELERAVDDVMRAHGMGPERGAFANHADIRNAFVRFVVDPPSPVSKDDWDVERLRDDAATHIAAMAKSRKERKRSVEEIVREYRIFLHVYETVRRVWTDRATV